MARDERPAKMQKREHSPQTEEAAFAETTAPAAAANGSPDSATPTTGQPDAAKNGNDDGDAMSVDDNTNTNHNETSADNTEPSTTAAAAAAADQQQPAKPGPPPGMTKSAWKKQKRQQEWEAGRDARKAQRKEKNKARKERKRQAYHEGGGRETAHQQQQQQQQKAVQVPITFVFDCSFDELMMDKEMKSLGQQITRAYSDNRNAPFRAHLCVSSFGGKLKERFDGLLNKHYQSWKGFRVFEEDFVEVAEKAKAWMGDLREGGRLAGALAEIEASKREAGAEDAAAAGGEDAGQEKGEVVYLSSEGTETLHELKPHSTYIIGGLVDKNRYKGICHKRATERGIKTAKLPIGEFLQMNSRSVLATNHVNEIMLQWLACGDWGEAFMKVIPKRKGGQLRGAGEEAEAEEEEDEANDRENAEAEKVAAEASNDASRPEEGSGAAEAVDQPAEAADVQAA